VRTSETFTSSLSTFSTTASYLLASCCWIRIPRVEIVLVDACCSTRITRRSMVDEPASPGTTSPPPRKPTPVRRLHEPFVSPEFGANQISPRVDGGMGGDGPERPMTAARNSNNPHHLAAAPLYTVNAACADSHGVLSAPPPALSGSLLLRKRLDVADAGRLSVIGSASGNPLIPASLKSMGFQPTSNNLPPSAPGNVIEATGTVKAPPTSPRDLTPLVTEALCSWGQALRSILGQAVRESVTAERRLQVSSARGPSLMTTGLFPQTMTLR